MLDKIEADLSSLPIWRGETTGRVAITLEGGLGDFVLLYSRLLKFAALDKQIPLFLTYGTGAPHAAKAELIELWKKQPWCPADLISHGASVDLSDVSFRCDLRALMDLFIEPITRTFFPEQWPAPQWRAPKRSLEELGIPEAEKPVVGLCCRAGNQYFPDPRRSMNSRQIEQLIRSFPTFCWVNVNEEKIDLPGVVNAYNPSIAHLAGVLSACDFVVSVDSFPMHLSSAMGKKTFVLLQAQPDTWLWENNPAWYSSLEIIRTPRGIDGDIDHLQKLLAK